MYDWDGILSSEYTVCGNRFYYNVSAFKKIPSPYGGGGYNYGYFRVHTYTDLVTRESNAVCPDPLCKHDDLFTCMYNDFGSDASFCVVENNLFYVERMDFKSGDGSCKIYKNDLRNNRTKLVYTPMDIVAGFKGEENGVVYLQDTKFTMDREGKTAGMDFFILGLSTETDEILFKRTVPADCGVLFIRGGKIFCRTTKTLRVCDMNFENAKTLFDFAGMGSLATWYYDENRDEFWFSVIENNAQTGRIFRITADGESEEIRLPSEKVYFFQLTNTKIYYTEYEPRLLGIHPRSGQGVYDYSGGKIYAVDRDNPGEDPVAVYDTKGKYLLCRPGSFTYTVFGDQLFIPVAELVREGESVEISIAGMPMAHINLTTGEEEIIGLD